MFYRIQDCQIQLTHNSMELSQFHQNLDYQIQSLSISISCYQYSDSEIMLSRTQLYLLNSHACILTFMLCSQLVQFMHVNPFAFSLPHMHSSTFKCTDAFSLQCFIPQVQKHELQSISSILVSEVRVSNEFSSFEDMTITLLSY